MKKVRAIAFLFVLIFFIIPFAYAQGTPSAEEAIESQFGVNPGDITEIRENITNNYLKGEWGKIIESKPLIGPIHRYFVAHPNFFKIIFNHAYEFSLTFMIIFVFWLLIASLTYDGLRYSGLKQFSILAGVLMAIIIAHTTALLWFAEKVVNISTNQDLWYVRIILWLIFFVFLVVFWQSGKILKGFMKKKFDEKQKVEIIQKQTNQSAFIDGVKEGQKISK